MTIMDKFKCSLPLHPVPPSHGSLNNHTNDACLGHQDLTTSPPTKCPYPTTHFNDQAHRNKQTSLTTTLNIHKHHRQSSISQRMSKVSWSTQLPLYTASHPEMGRKQRHGQSRQDKWKHQKLDEELIIQRFSQ